LYSTKFNMCTFLIETLYFLLLLFVLLSFLLIISLFFLQIMEDFALPKRNICTSWCQYICTSCSHISVLPVKSFYYVSNTFTWNMHFQNWTFVLPRACLYISLYMIYYFSSTSRESCTSKTDYLYFPSSPWVLLILIVHTSLILQRILLFLQSLAGTFAVSKVEHLYLPSTMWLPIVIVCTFLIFT
jgi:hypothetical protein